jgi:hypothetical protein
MPTKRRRARSPRENSRPSLLSAENGSGAVYTYVDEHGKARFHVHRFPPKDFRQQNARTGAWNLNGVRRVLYRLPQVIEAAKRGDIVYIVDGEKDVESAEAVGAVATCCPGGMDKWRDEYSKWLRGARVLIVWDRDGPHNDWKGQRAAPKVAESLKRAGVKSVRFRRARDGKDLTDHLLAGYDIEQLIVQKPKPPPRQARSKSTYGDGPDCPVCGGSRTVRQDRRRSQVTGQMAYFFHCVNCPYDSRTYFELVKNATGRTGEDLKRNGL